MPYNTRRKSLSLPALGIQLPNTTRSHRASISKPSNDPDAAQPPPAKRAKRSHASESSPSPDSPLQTPSSASTSPNAPKTVTFADRPKSSGRTAVEHTPPPSPGGSHDVKVDIEGINDDIVVGVVEQLEKTGNRPHLIKELATVLSTTNESVASSANPAALLSSRLATYMRRSWTALSPCPIAKELIPVHPRKVFYYLTTKPRQELAPSSLDILTDLPGPRAAVGTKRIISPSLSNASQDDDDPAIAEDRKRAALSPSPEIDLSLDLEDDVPIHSAHPGSVPDFPTPPATVTSAGYVSARGSNSREGSDPERDLGLNRRAESPALEGDEQEFTATARGLRERGLSKEDNPALGTDVDSSHNDGDRNTNDGVVIDKTVIKTEADVELSEEEKASHSREAAAALFEGHAGAHAEQAAMLLLSSPTFKPVAPVLASGSNELALGHAQAAAGDATKTAAGLHHDDADNGSILGSAGRGTWDVSRPETMALDELDDLLDDFY